MIKVVHKKPMFWFIVKFLYPQINWEIIVMTFGNTIYSKNPFSKERLVHEEVHIKQMYGSKIIASIYFIIYYFSKRFRYRMELEAFRAEYQLYHQGLFRMARQLSGPLYGNIITYEEAIKLIDNN